MSDDTKTFGKFIRVHSCIRGIPIVSVFVAYTSAINPIFLYFPTNTLNPTPNHFKTPPHHHPLCKSPHPSSCSYSLFSTTPTPSPISAPSPTV